jgi:hypothetical protein
MQQQLALKRQQEEQQQRAEHERQQLEQQQRQAEYERKQFEQQQQMQAEYEKQQLVRQQQADNEKRLLQQQQQAEYEASLLRSKQAQQPEQLSSSDDDTVPHYTSETKIVCRPYPSPLTVSSVMSPSLEYQQQFQEHFGHQAVEKRSSMLYTPGSRPSSKMSIEQMMEELNEPLPPMQPLPTDLLTNFQHMSTFQSSSQHVQSRSSTHEWQPQAFGTTAGLTDSSMTQSASSYSAAHKTTTSRSYDESSTQPVSS